MTLTATALSDAFKALREVGGFSLVSSTGESVVAVVDDAPEYAERDNMPRKLRAEFSFVYVLRGEIASPREVETFSDYANDRTYEVLEVSDNPAVAAVRFFCVIHSA